MIALSVDVRGLWNMDGLEGLLEEAGPVFERGGHHACVDVVPSLIPCPGLFDIVNLELTIGRNTIFTLSEDLTRVPWMYILASQVGEDLDLHQVSVEALDGGISTQNTYDRSTCALGKSNAVQRQD